MSRMRELRTSSLLTSQPCTHIDLSIAAYDGLGQSRDVGVIDVKWTLS